ncbi:MAG: alpha/beta fold hydrolase [Dehalococcoidia bacterium]|nr:alpha/beta fold hydrolase [Dehalococcoidia bacterium]
MPYVKHRGFRLHYETAGEGPPLVLQHGFGGSGRRWRKLGYDAALAGRYRLVMPDALGHGASDGPRESAAYSETQRCGDLLAVLDHAGIERAHLFGYSLGGRLVLRTAILHPERVGALVVGGIHPFLPPAGRGPLDRRALRALDDGAGGGRGPIRRRMIDRAMGEALRWAWRLRGRNPHALAALVRYSQEHASSLEEHLGGVDRPCLIFGGDADPIAPAELLARFAAGVPGAELFLVPGAGHEALERRDEVLAHVEPFLARAVEAEGAEGQAAGAGPGA